MVKPSRHCLPIAIALAGLMAACDHTLPPGPQNYAPRTTFLPGDPVRVTYNPGVDERPSWLPDGSAYLYTQERLDIPERDRCFAEQAATGATIERTICSDQPSSADTLNAFESPALTGDGRLAYLRTAMAAFKGHVGPDHAELVLATYASPLDARVLRLLPFFGPNGRPIVTMSNLHWVGANTLVFLGENQAYEGVCGCALDTLRWGLEIDRLFLGAGGGPDSIRAVPGTDGASSVAAAGGDTIFFTLAGDSKLYRQSLAGGGTDVVRDLGGIVRDVNVAAGRLTAVIGGTVNYLFDSAQSAFIQRDRGGNLWVLDLRGGGEDTVTIPSAFVRRPAPAPDGGTIAFEVYPYVVDTVLDGETIISIDTIFARVGDIWRMRLR